MDNDDRPVGRILSRREVLALLGAAGTAVLAACATAPAVTRTASAPVPTSATEPTTAPTSAPTSAPASEPTLLPTTAALQEATAEATAAAEAALPACVVSPELTEGPYFVDEKLNRSDIRSNTPDGAVKDGALLKLTLHVSKVNGSGCTPLQGAMVDIWHCDASGVYSDATDRSFNTVGQDFLRGYQLTDANGAVQFTTIYPGWYQGRAVHIHFKVRGADSSNRNYEFTSQFFFDDAFSEQVYAQAPYASKGVQTLRNEQDNIYRQSGGATVLNVVVDGTSYASSFDIGLQLA
jgi:protocatechuate 3,4-dioxygenase beta subunit